MKTELVEFKNPADNLLRGLLVTLDKSRNKGVIFLHGFEGMSTTNPKFKRFSDKLVEENMPSFRFDFSGCGISDGNFKDTSVEKETKELQMALYAFKEVSDVSQVHIVAHSLSTCVVANYLQKVGEFNSRIVFLAPALNQKEILRYLFVKDFAGADKEVTWENYRDLLDEEKFDEFCEDSEKLMKAHYLGNEYTLENRNKDYTPFVKPYNSQILHVHGTEDETVPLKSVGFNFSNQLMVKGGDHKLNRPDLREQWLGKAVDFLTS